MRIILMILFLVFSAPSFSQKHINIGSTKEDVKRVQGEPTSISNFDPLNEEIWGYGEYGLATVTFKNGIVESYNNYDKILKIGKRKKISTLDDLAKDIQETKRSLAPKIPEGALDIDKYLKDKGIRVANGLQGSHNIPQAGEMFELYGNNWQAIEGMDYSKIIAAKKEELRNEEILKWFGITIAIIVAIFSIIFIKKLIK